MYNPHAFSNYVKKTLNHGLSLSEVDLGDLKRESTKHGPSLMEVDWGGKSGPTTHQVDACSCKLTGEENSESTHINECMPSELDWGAHETHQKWTQYH